MIIKGVTLLFISDKKPPLYSFKATVFILPTIESIQAIVLAMDPVGLFY